MKTVFESDISELAPWLVEELQLPAPVSAGSQGMAVRRVQEWLNLRGYHLVPDGVFGVATAETVARFQQDAFLPETGRVDADTFERLTEPLRDALRMRLDKSLPIGEAALVQANAHLAQHPREVGGNNRGPWVRAYMRGREGRQWAWCAGFATFLLRQAAESMQISMPIDGSFSCDILASQAKAKDMFVPGGRANGSIAPGSLFLTRRASEDWNHVGLVVEADTLTLTTIEGNTKDSQSDRVDEVCMRTRSYDNRDFIVFDA